MSDRGDEMSHITFDTLVDYVDGMLTSAETEGVEEHLAANCDQCSADLQWVREKISLMKTDDWIAPPAEISRAVRLAFVEEFQPAEPVPSIFDRLRGWLAVRPQVAWAAAAALVFVIALVVLQLRTDGAVDQDATVVERTGEVIVLAPDSDEWQPVDDDTVFSAGDIIRTGDDSVVVITYADGSYTVVSANTEIEIIEMSSYADGSQVTVLAQARGQTDHKVMPLVGDDSVFEVQTPAATANVLGTTFTVVVDHDGETDVSVREGVVGVTAAGVTVQVAAGQMTTIAMGNPPTTATAIPSPTATATSERELSVDLQIGDEQEDLAEDLDEASPTPTPTRSTRTPRPTATRSNLLDPTETMTATSPPPTNTPLPPTSTPPPPTATPPPPPTNTPPPPPPTNTPPPPTSTPPPPTATPPPPTPTDEATPYPPPPTPPEPTDEPTPYPAPSGDDRDSSSGQPAATWEVPPGQTLMPPGQEDKTPVPPGQTRTPPGQDNK